MPDNQPTDGPLDAEPARTLRVADVEAHALAVFGPSRAHAWLLRPNPALGGAVPATLMQADPDRGPGQVDDLLVRIEQGTHS